jgi:hypothetical protein
VLYSADGNDAHALAALIGGASMPELKFHLPDDLLGAIPQMLPYDLSEPNGGPFALGETDRQYLVLTSKTVRLGLPSGSYIATWYSPESGKVIGETKQVDGAEAIDAPNGQRALLWVRRK